jgi:ubiquinone/menaquinone biosynthesis C-methylase UbiE
VIVVAHTTLYRDGGPRLAQAARTLASDARRRSDRVTHVAVESKRDLVRALDAVPEPIDELHLVTHSGLYGPMFGTTSMPEQFSPHEWRTLPIRFAPGGEAYFHACRTARWFAPFFARAYGVPASGHHWYTTVSRRPDRYAFVPSWWPEDAPLYVVGQPGKKSHGWTGAIGKHAGVLPPTPMQRHLPAPALGGPAYDRVAAAYDLVFEDIRVRGPEWRWLDARVPDGARVLDVGCGAGGLLRALRPRIGASAGVDASPAMLERARAREPEQRWLAIDAPKLPFPDASFDVVVSMLSWRYLDWDPMLAEIARVLVPGGRLLVVDMVAKPAEVRELPTALAHKVRERRHLATFPDYEARRAALVAEPAWAEMLRYNPIRAEHEYRWYFESRFKGRTVEVIDVGRNTRIVAFDAVVDRGWYPPQSYP